VARFLAHGVFASGRNSLDRGICHPNASSVSSEHLSVCVSVHSENSSFSSAVRLAKRWLASQMLLSDYIEEEAVELIVASLYLSPVPFTPPQYDLHLFRCHTQLLLLQFLLLARYVPNVAKRSVWEQCIILRTDPPTDRPRILENFKRPYLGNGSSDHSCLVLG